MNEGENYIDDGIGEVSNNRDNVDKKVKTLVIRMVKKTFYISQTSSSISVFMITYFRK